MHGNMLDKFKTSPDLNLIFVMLKHKFYLQNVVHPKLQELSNWCTITENADSLMTDVSLINYL